MANFQDSIPKEAILAQADSPYKQSAGATEQRDAQHSAIGSETQQMGVKSAPDNITNKSSADYANDRLINTSPAGANKTSQMA